MKTALIVHGGWEGHEPARFADLFRQDLEPHGFNVTLSDRLAVLEDADSLRQYDLVVPTWSMGEITERQRASLSSAVAEGVGLGGIHGGMCDAFRGDIEYQWMTGGQFLGHPHVGDFMVCRTGEHNEITDHLPDAFPYNSEQYYMMVDPGVRVLADTLYRHQGVSCRMPVVWIRQWGRGRVFFSSLGHAVEEFTRYPHVREMTLRGLLWAAR